MARLLLYPGETGPVVGLQDFMRDVHNDARQQRERDIKQRKESGVTSNEHADMVAAQVAAQAAVNAGAAGNEQAFRRAIEDAQKAMGPDALSPIPEYVPSDDIDGITVSFRMLTEKQRRMLSSAVMAAADGSYPSIAEHIQAVSDARAAVVRHAVAEVGGLETQAGPLTIKAEGDTLSDRDLEALKAAGLHSYLYDAAIAFQVLPAKKGLRFGLSAGSALSGTSAPGAPSSDAPSSDATEGQALLSSLGPSTSLTPVPAVS